MNASDDGILTLLDAQPSSRGGRRSKIKKKVSFSTSVKDDKNEDPHPHSQPRQGGNSQSQFIHEATEQGADQNDVEVPSFSRPSRGNTFKYSLDDLFDDAGLNPNQYRSKTGMQDFQIPSSESINKKDVQNVSSTVNSRGLGIDTSAEENMMQNVKGQEPSTRQELDIHQPAINRNSVEAQAPISQRDTDPMRNSNLSKSLANSDAHRMEINPETLDSLVDKLKERMEDTHRIISKEFSQSLQEQLVSTIHDKSNAGTEQIKTALLRLDDVITDFKSVVTLDGVRLRNEESKLSQLHESLVTVREKANERFREEQRQVAEERAVIEQWRENISKELTNRKIEIEKTEVGIYERERDIDHRESMFRQHEEHEHLSIKREKEDLKERHLTLTEYEEELKDQRIRIDVQVEDIHVERGRLQDMAEQIKLLSKTLAHKAEVAEESLLKAEQMTAETEARNAALSVKQNELEKKIETIKYEKMDLARQRVEFLKERSYSRQYRQ